MAAETPFSSYTTAATAPFEAASAINDWLSVFEPGMHTNKAPGVARRESMVIERMSPSPNPLTGSNPAFWSKAVRFKELQGP